MERVDVLPRHRAALGCVRGGVDAGEPDPELQRLVELASAAFAMPTAALTLVLAWSQRFRAHVGMPRALVEAGGSPRDVSLCQLVVRDEALVEVNDTHADPRVPQELVRVHGFRSYLGAPVWLGGHVIGSLCLLDVAVRTFDEQDRALLTRLADDAGRRLDELARADGSPPALDGREPAVVAVHDQKRQVQTVLGTLALFREVLGQLERSSLPAPQIVRELASALADGEAAAVALRGSVLAVEQAYVDVPHVAVTEILTAATTLLRARRPTLGAPRWASDSVGTFVAVPRPQAVRLIAGVMTAVGSTPGTARVEGTISVRQGDVVVQVAAPTATPAWLRDQVAALRALASSRDGLDLRAEGQGLAVVMRTSITE